MPDPKRAKVPGSGVGLMVTLALSNTPPSVSNETWLTPAPRFGIPERKPETFGAEVKSQSTPKLMPVVVPPGVTETGPKIVPLSVSLKSKRLAVPTPVSNEKVNGPVTPGTLVKRFVMLLAPVAEKVEPEVTGPPPQTTPQLNRAIESA